LHTGPERWILRPDKRPGGNSEGVLVDLTGFPGRDNFHVTLSDVPVRQAGGGFPVSAKDISADEPFHGDHTGELVTVDGRLIGTTQVMGNPALLLSTGQVAFTAVLPDAAVSPDADPNQESSPMPAWVEGSTVRVTGVFSSVIDADQVARHQGIFRLESFQIFLRSPHDVAVLKTPSWWTGSHALLVLSLVASLTLAVLGWVVVLRHRVAEQTFVIRRSEEKFRQLARHDSLTGLFMRTVLPEALDLAVEIARAHRTHLPCS
jgi:hypothetical protein